MGARTRDCCVGGRGVAKDAGGSICQSRAGLGTCVSVSLSMGVRAAKRRREGDTAELECKLQVGHESASPSLAPSWQPLTVALALEPAPPTSARSRPKGTGRGRMVEEFLRLDKSAGLLPYHHR